MLLTTGAVVDPHLAGLPADVCAPADATAAALPHARRTTIEVQGDVADPVVLGPVLVEFLAG